MRVSVKDIVDTLRLEISISNSQAGVEDEGLLDMTDEQIITIIKLGATRLDEDAETLEEVIEDGYAYPLTLLAKIELLYTLATLKADLVDMNADNNNRLSLGQRWQHYSGLIEAAQKDYDKWDADNSGSSGGTGGVITSYDVILNSRHFTERNYNTQNTPKVRLRIDEVGEDFANIRWDITQSSHFAYCRVYIGTSPVFDRYLDGGKSENKITESAQLIKSTMDIRDNAMRVLNLIPDTEYFVAVVAVEKNTVYGYSQKVFKTLTETEE